MLRLLLLLCVPVLGSLDMQTHIQYTITITFQASVTEWFELFIPVDQVGNHLTFSTHVTLGVCVPSMIKSASFALTIQNVISPHKHVVWHLLNTIKPVVFFDPGAPNASFICCRIDWVPVEVVREEQFGLTPAFPGGPCLWQNNPTRTTMDWYTTGTDIRYYVTENHLNDGYYKCQFIAMWPKWRWMPS